MTSKRFINSTKLLFILLTVNCVVKCENVHFSVSQSSVPLYTVVIVRCVHCAIVVSVPSPTICSCEAGTCVTFAPVVRQNGSTRAAPLLEAKGGALLPRCKSAAVVISVKDCFHFKGHLDDHNYSDVSLSQAFSESINAVSLSLSRENLMVFFISDINQVKTHNQNNEL